MKLILILFLKLAVVNLVLADTKRLDLSENEAKELSEYFVSLGNEQKAKIPVKLATNEVKLYGFMSGMHLIAPKENESMLAIFGNKVVGEKKVKIIYKFTVTPEISFAESNKKDLNWNTILAERKVTQYLIEETEEKGEFILKKTLLKLAKSSFLISLNIRR